MVTIIIKPQKLSPVQLVMWPRMLHRLIQTPSTYLIELHLEEIWKRIDDDCGSCTNKYSKEHVTDFYMKKKNNKCITTH